MSSPLAQDLAQKIIEVLLSRGHVLLTKGGKPALVRELGDRMNDTLATIVGRMPPPGIVDNEVTSTFGDESLDDAVEEMVEDITASLMDSDQVEDVFSEDAQIRRDVFRVVKDTLLSADRAFGETEEADVEVTLSTLGYVATKAAQRAEASVVESALAKAAKSSHAKLLEYTPATQTARFRAALATPDARLELEEAVADELSNLVDEGKVELPTIERSIALGRSVASDERHATRARIDVAATRTLLRSGCTATWEYAGDDTIVVSLVPMSDQDARAVDPFFEAFVREVQGIFSRPRPPSDGSGLDAWLRLARTAEPKPAASLKRPSDAPLPVKKVEKAPVSKRGVEKEPVSKRGVEKEPVSKRDAEKAPVTKRAVEKAPASKKAEKAPASKRGVEKAPASKRDVEKAPASKRATEKAPASKRATEKAPASARATAKKAPKKEGAAKGAKAKKPGPRSKPAAKLAKSPARRPAAKLARKPEKKAAKPAKRAVAKAAKKPVAEAAKKAVARKPVAKVKAAKKPVAKAKRPIAKAAKRAVARKPVARKAVAKRPVAKKAVARKPATRRPVAKPAKRAVAKRAVAKKPVRRPVPKKAVARRPAKRPAKRPLARPAKKLAKPARRPAAKPARKPLPRPARRPAKRPTSKAPKPSKRLPARRQKKPSRR